MVKECIAGFKAAWKRVWTKLSELARPTHRTPLRTLMDSRSSKATGVFETWSKHSLRHNFGPVKTNPLLQIVSAFQPGMAKRLLDPCQKAGVSFGFLECSTPRTHVRSKKRTRGRQFLQDANTQNGPPVHETAQHLSCEYGPSAAWRVTFRFSMPRTLSQNCSVVVISVGGVSNNKTGK